MREFNFASLNKSMADATLKEVKSNKQACKSLQKAKRKLRKAMHAKALTEMQICIGMAKVAIDKANSIANRSK